VIGRGNYHWQHEPCWYAVRSGRKASWTGGRSQSTVWDIAGVKMRAHDGEDVEDAPSQHGTQKPVECMRRPIENNSRAGDSVYDPFLGSGTTLIAAEQSARTCFGLEIDPKYVDVIVRRWQNFTGEKAILSGIKRTFDEIEAERVHERLGRPMTTTETDSVAGS
jgi:DNA modification methylase